MLCSQVKLQSNKEQLVAARKQSETVENTQQTLENRLSELTALLDESKSRCSQLAQEKEMLTKTLDSVRAEKNALDKNRVEINAMVSSVLPSRPKTSFQRCFILLKGGE